MFFSFWASSMESAVDAGRISCTVLKVRSLTVCGCGIKSWLCFKIIFWSADRSGGPKFRASFMLSGRFCGMFTQKEKVRLEESRSSVEKGLMTFCVDWCDVQISETECGSLVGKDVKLEKMGCEIW